MSKRMKVIVGPEREPQVRESGLCDAERLAEVYWNERKPQALADWVRERLENCKRIASAKVGADRKGWLEDAWYFEQILSELAAAQRALPTGQAGGRLAAGGQRISLESATTIGEEIIKEYQKLERDGYTHWNKANIGRMVQARVDAALAAADPQVEERGKT